MGTGVASHLCCGGLVVAPNRPYLLYVIICLTTCLHAAAAPGAGCARLALPGLHAGLRAHAVAPHG